MKTLFPSPWVLRLEGKTQESIGITLERKDPRVPSTALVRKLAMSKKEKGNVQDGWNDFDRT